MVWLLPLFVIIFASSAQARPVSYPGGWTVIQTNDSESHSLLWHYSPSAKYSLGYRLEYMRDGDYTLNMLQNNILLKRWNERDSQANLYLKSAIGAAYSDHGDFEGEIEPAAFTGMAADWEDRRYFISYENRASYAGDIDRGFSQRARVGIAPYIGDYGDLHTWLMLELQHFPKRDEHFRVAPLVRFFKGVGLMEAGIDSEGDLLFNWIYRF